MAVAPSHRISSFSPPSHSSRASSWIQSIRTTRKSRLYETLASPCLSLLRLSRIYSLRLPSSCLDLLGSINATMLLRKDLMPPLRTMSGLYFRNLYANVVQNISPRKSVISLSIICFTCPSSCTYTTVDPIKECCAPSAVAPCSGRRPSVDPSRYCGKNLVYAEGRMRVHCIRLQMRS